MMDVILVIRQMMADSKFVEAQREVEAIFFLKDEALRKEALPLYLEILAAQNKRIPVEMIIEVAERFLQNDIDQSIRWMSLFPKNEIDRYFFLYQKIKIFHAERKGLTAELYQLISKFQITLFTSRVPVIPEFLKTFTLKYFAHDFNLGLQRLSLEIMIGDYETAEATLRNLVLSCFEQSSPRSTRTKLSHISDILDTCQHSSQLDIYRGLCSVYAHEITAKTDYKRIAEAIIFFDDFKFQTLLLNLLVELGLDELASEYAISVKQSKDYNFVYFDKFFPQLKKLFVTLDEKTELPKTSALLTNDDIKLEEKVQRTATRSIDPVEHIDEESHFISMLNYQENTTAELLEIATSFIQSQMPRVSLKAADQALKSAENNEMFLKAAYLKMMSLLQLNDFRSALDLSIEASGRATSPEDVLSFLYVQAELFQKLGENKTAKSILQKIQNIDADYRLTKERLIRLNEI
jgi:hypothetical protein